MSGQNLNPLAQLAAQQRAAATNPVFYVPASAINEIRAFLVQKIYVVCHPKTSASGSGETNHWTLAFDIGNGEGVGLDIQPDPSKPHSNGGFKASVIVSKLSYIVSSTVVRAEQVSIVYSRPVGWYIDYLADGGRFRYAFTPGDVGCRNWITDTLKLLADMGEVNGHESESARNALAYVWPDCILAAPAVGTYFT